MSNNEKKHSKKENALINRATKATAFLLAASSLSLISCADGGQNTDVDARNVPTTNDYSNLENWLCHPRKDKDVCDVDVRASIIAASGSVDVQSKSDQNSAEIDCFYVYPTVSEDSTPNSDMIANEEERRVVEQQLAPFKSVCRTFAPLYRQITLPHLRAYARTGEFTAHPTLNYDDVRAAWHSYLDNQNDGRGVILIGHSQGAGLVNRLAKEEIVVGEAKNRLISVFAIGTNLYPDENGAFVLPPCEEAAQIGCMIGYLSFRDTSRPTSQSRLAQANGAGDKAMCVNPANLTGANSLLDPLLATTVFSQDSEFTYGLDEEIETRFVKLPEFLKAKCKSNDTHSWLSVSVLSDPNDPRVDDIAGDVVINGNVLSHWGLHLIDVNLAMGNLISIAEAQSRAWRDQLVRSNTGEQTE